MNILMITRKVDYQDASPSGFAFRWIEKLADRLEKVNVICLEKGDLSQLPENVRVFSLGKEKGFGKWRMFWRFFKISPLPLRESDFVLAHQNPEYVFMISPLAKLYREEIIFWYAHGYAGWKLILASWLVDRIATSSEKGCRLKNRKKIKVVGQGIDVQYFKPSSVRSESGRLRILSIGRISPVKGYEILIEAAENLIRKGIENLEVKIVGGAGLKKQERYLDRLKKIVQDKKLDQRIQFLGPIPNNQILAYYQNSDLFVNMSRTGSLDKVVLEAMACQKPVLTSNEAFRDILDERFLFQDSSDLSDKIVSLINTSQEEKKRIGEKLRDIVVKNHNLDNLIDRIIQLGKDEIKKN